MLEDVADQVERVRSGQATWNKALLLLLERSGYPAETYHSFSYSSLHQSDGSVGGLLCVVSEETERVIAESDTLRQLGMALVGAPEAEVAADLMPVTAKIAGARQVGPEVKQFCFATRSMN